MDAIFTWLTDAIRGAPWLAVVAATGWGVASLVLSPCHLASIPLVVGFIARRNGPTPQNALACSTLFALGILGSIALVGAVTAMLGRMLGDSGAWATYGVALLLLVIGLHLLGVLELPLAGGRFLPLPAGKGAALLLGLVFGVALGPCTFAYLAPVLGLVFTVARTQPVFAIVLLCAFAIGHCSLIVLAGVSTDRVQRVLAWNDRSAGAVWLRRGSGILVVAGALWLATTARA